MQALHSPWFVLVFTAALGISASALAHDYALKNLRIINPTARATPPGARTGGAYLTIENRGRDNERLVRVASPVADSAQLHMMRVEGGMMRMRDVTSVGIPAGSVMTLAPGGYHVMLVGLKRPLVAGDAFPLALTFEKSGTIEVLVTITELDASTASPAAGMSMPAPHPAR
jgi:hypothetical protein